MSGFVSRFKVMPDKVKEMFAETIEKYAVQHDFDSIFLLTEVIDFPMECESPIEQILLYALQIVVMDMKCWDIQFSTQEEVKVNGHSYRLDLYFEEDAENPIKVAIECDGHAFHEKTKEQVAYRNRRDMDLKSNGIDILHCSGSQIYKEPFGVACDIINYVNKLISDKRRE